MKTLNHIRHIGLLISCVLICWACSKGGESDVDPDNPGGGKNKLSVTASATSVPRGTEVTFTTSAGSQAIDADIYVDNTKITGNTHTFATSGSFTVIAKKSGYTDSDALRITATPIKTAKFNFNKVNTAPYTPAFNGGGTSRMAMSDTHLYVFNNNTRAFRRYNMQTNTWQDLRYDNQLRMHRSSCDLVYVKGAMGGKDALFSAEGGQLHMYSPSEHAIVAGRGNTWFSNPIPAAYGGGTVSRGIIAVGSDVYFVGDLDRHDIARQVDKLSPHSNTWSKQATLPQVMREPVMAEYEKKIYILGKPRVGAMEQPFPVAMYVYDTQARTSSEIPLPERLKASMGNLQYEIIFYYKTLVATKNHVIVSAGRGHLYVYDIAAGKWLDGFVDVSQPKLFDHYKRINYFALGDDKFYAAGSKDGDFVLYKIDFNTVME